MLGPKGLPEMARKLGGWMRRFRSATSELRGTFEGEFYKMDGGPASPARPAIRSVEGFVPRPSGPSSAVMPTSGPGVPAAPPAPVPATPFEAALQTGTSAPPATPSLSSDPAPPEAPAKPPEGTA